MGSGCRVLHRPRFIGGWVSVMCRSGDCGLGGGSSGFTGSFCVVFILATELCLLYCLGKAGVANFSIEIGCSSSCLFHFSRRVSQQQHWIKMAPTCTAPNHGDFAIQILGVTRILYSAQAGCNRVAERSSLYKRGWACSSLHSKL